jgi:glycine/sarcosine N-methyltransferase
MEFYDSISEYYEDIFPLDNSVRQFALSLGIKKEDAVLDIGCATGEFSFFLSQFADRIYGIDNNRTMISKAVRLRGACSGGSNPQFLVGDMTQLDGIFEGKNFNYIFCLGNTLVHLDRAGAESAIGCAVEHLAPGGSFIFQILNYDKIFRESVKQLPLIDNDRIIFERSYIYGENHLIIEFTGKMTVKNSLSGSENRTKIYPLLTNDLFAIFRDLPFQRKEIFGGFNFECCTKDSFITVGVLSHRL